MRNSDINLMLGAIYLAPHLAQPIAVILGALFIVAYFVLRYIES